MAVGTLTFSGSYATGGEVPTVASPPGGTGLKQLMSRLGFGEILYVDASSRGNTVEFVDSTDKLKVFTAANTEHTAAAYNAALTASPVPCIIWGR